MDFAIQEKLKEFLNEDVGCGDITSEFVVVPEEVHAEVACREAGLLAGSSEGSELLELSGIRVLEAKTDGSRIAVDDVILRMLGENRRILTVERTLLNLISRMSGIATLTADFVHEARLGNPDVRIAATRKTAPGLRWFDKKAVVVGGGDSHRMGLSDAVLIKDNHIDASGDLLTCVSRARERTSYMHRIEVEVNCKEDALLAAKEGVDVVMLDNMNLEDIEGTISALRASFPRFRPTIEVSGGVTLENVRSIASAGPDVISVGRLTHSPRHLDFTLRLLTGS